MGAPLRCLVLLPGLGAALLGQVRSVPHDDVATWHHAGDAALAASDAAKSAATAHQIAVRSERAVVDAIAALRLTQEALRDARATSDADEVGGLINSLDAEQARAVANTGDADAQAHREQLEKMETKLKKLEHRYETEESEQKAAQDADSGRRLDAIRRSLQVAEGQLDIAAGHGTYPGPTKVDIDTAVVPHPGAVESFGEGGTAGALTADSVVQSDAMVDSIEKAQNMESKRSVYRALTHLRGATITAYDGIAHAHMKNVENYAKNNQWRLKHQIHHLAEEESDTAKWAFPVRHPSDVVIVAPAAANVTAAAPAPAPAEQKDPAATAPEANSTNSTNSSSK
eukprot:TRINITY_DN14296_c0_g1_i1.p1 TRINITY_DN14296_c0_g1~~TRINITY_DN14296_c0_g1_i1.p1  ORF type:complete len:366 (-),score=79.56 TRINITY_DN14296_c0_g1_i1:257-1282(-)